MSKGYGWQCESAILPSKSNPINNVDSKSILALKAIISKPSLSTRPRKSEDDIHPSAKKSKIDFHYSGKKREIGVKSEKSLNEDSEKESKVLQSLTAKAKLYEEMANRKDNSSALNGGLVDFKRKSGDVNHHGESEVFDFVIDRGGSNKNESSREQDVDNENSRSNKWNWSRGVPNSEEHIDYESEYRQQKGLSKLIDDRIANEPVDANNVSRGAKVKSRWDLTLQSSSKAFLADIHHQTERQRSSKVGGTGMDSREERMEKLRAKQLQLAKEQEEERLER